VPSSGGSESKFPQTAGGVFRREADEICTDLETEVEFETSMLEDSFGHPYDDSGRLVLTTEQRAEVLAVRARTINRGIRRLRALQAPPGMAANYDHYLDERQAFADGLRDLRDALVSGDSEAVAQTSAEVQDRLVKKRQSASLLGFEACADRLFIGDQRHIASLVKNFVTGRNPESVCRQLTDAMLEGAYGSVSNCVERLRSAPLSSSAEIVDLYGVDQVHAFVTVATDDGDLPALVDYQAGDWKLDALVASSR
jgi:hypothetical protein